ncbi:MAG: THxN family PEP-CTERM protein [Scytonema sp. PMC 1069.18]|nr:THxN family PEP-CTERM protein [Scytonema sp. PMC 1069.18]MEC4880471.1 THxN family PEP-CTERM protein [Scytonema sp. PMC 1070.18]
MKSIKSVLGAISFISTIVGCGIPAIAVDFRLNSITGSWENPIGSPIVTGEGTNRIEWGVAVAGSFSSGLQFDSVTPPSVTVSNTSDFVLGRLTHFNYPTENPLRSVDLNIALNLENAQPTFRYRFDIDETENNIPIDDCPSFQSSITACDDKIGFSASNFTPTTFSVDGQDYTLQLVGFSSTPDGSRPISQFITEERKDNSAFLIARITTPQVERVSEPTTIAALFILSLYSLNRRRKKSSDSGLVEID